MHKENQTFLKHYIHNDVRLMRLSETFIRTVFEHPIVKWHTNNHCRCLRVLVTMNPEVEKNLLDTIGLVLVRMCWPNDASCADYTTLFNKLINEKMNTAAIFTNDDR